METSTSEIQKIVKSGGQQGNLMTALVEARKRNENQKNLKIMQASMKDDPRTIAQQFEEENNQEEESVVEETDEEVTSPDTENTEEVNVEVKENTC